MCAPLVVIYLAGIAAADPGNAIPAEVRRPRPGWPTSDVAKFVRRGDTLALHLSWAGSRCPFWGQSPTPSLRVVPARRTEWARTRPRPCPGLGWRETRSEGAMAEAKVGTASELVPGVVRGAGRYAVGSANGELFAVTRRCRHLGADLAKGSVDQEGCLVCPWHGARYDVATGRMTRARGLLRKGPRPRCWLPADEDAATGSRAGRARRHLVCPIVPCSLRRGG